MLSEYVTFKIVGSFKESVTIETLMFQLIISTVFALVTSLVELQSFWSRTLNKAKFADDWFDLWANSGNSKLATWSRINFQLWT